MMKQHQPKKPLGSKAGYNSLVGNLGNELNQTAAQVFGKIVKAQDQTLNFLDTESGKHVGLRTEKLKPARTSLLRAGLITFKPYCGGTGGSYSLTARGMSKVLQYWPEFSASPRNHNVTAKPTSPAVVQIVVVPPSKLTNPAVAA